MWLFHFLDILLYYCTCNVASVTVKYVIYEQQERVFHRDIQTRENNVWKHEREA